MQPLPPGTNFIPEMSIPLSVFICSGDVLLAQVLLKLKNDPNKAKTLFYCINLIYLKKKKIRTTLLELRLMMLSITPGIRPRLSLLLKNS